MILGWLDRLLDKISFLVCDRSRGCGQAGFPKLSILRLNSLMASSCGKARAEKHKLLAALVKQCAFPL
jgi:hypothetical protein